MTEQKQLELIEENRRLRFRLEEDLQLQFDQNEEAYLAACRKRDTLETLEGCLQEKEKLGRHIDRQLAHIRKELTVLSGCTHDLAERIRREMGRIDVSIKRTLAAFQVEDEGARPSNPTHQTPRATNRS